MTLEFLEPRFLLLLLTLPPLAWWWLRTRRGALRHPSAASLRHLPAGRGPLAFWGGLALRLLALACVVVALAGPRWPDLKTRVRADGIAIMMVVDISGSMATPDFDWQGRPVSRLDAVKRVFRLFVQGGESPDGTRLEGRPTDEIGLVVFGSIPDTGCPLTLSHSALVRALDEQRPRKIPGESQTNLIDAVALGLHRLHQTGPRRKVMILLSDGEHNVPDPASGWTLARAEQVAAAQGVPVYTIDAAGTGISETEPNSAAASVATREIAVKTLKRLSEATKGRYFRADNTDALLDVYRAIDREEREPIESYQYRRYHEGYPWLALAAFVLFAGVLVLEMTLWRRVP
jgi:Ca-activated chloride channel family protein